MLQWLVGTRATKMVRAAGLEHIYDGPKALCGEHFAVARL
jgi:hypothetical protein